MKVYLIIEADSESAPIHLGKTFDEIRSGLIKAAGEEDLEEGLKLIDVMEENPVTLLQGDGK